MGKTLRRYLLREVVGMLFLGLVLTTFVLASVQMVDLIDLALAKGVALQRVFTVFAYMIPSYLELTLPMAFLAERRRDVRATWHAAARCSRCGQPG